MVLGTLLKKQKTTEMAAANLPPRSPTKFTRHQVKSEKNKQNRSKVQLHQKTGSRSYIAHRYSLELLVVEKDREPEAAAEAEACMKAEFEATLQAEREEAARKQEELQAQLQAQQAALEENKSVAASCPQYSKRLRYECSL